MSTHAKIPSGLGARRDQTYHEDEHGSYKLQGKLEEPTGAVAADWQEPGSKERRQRRGHLNLTPFA
jgi:hypothetical protein